MGGLAQVALTGISVTGGNAALPGAVAAVGAPVATLINGLATIVDSCAHYSKHGVAAASAAMPSGLSSESLPHIANIQALSRRDTLVLFFPNVAGAADYRAYAVKSGVSFTSTVNGRQPRGAVIACAGFRQRSYQVKSGTQQAREVQQAIELPGFVEDGTYTIIVEALSTPCPFVGMAAAFDASMTSNFPQGGVYKNTDFRAVLKSFDSVKAEYGNEIINGMESASSWSDRLSSPMGLDIEGNSNPVSPPGDPKVIARSAIGVQLPAADEAVNAPVIDVTNAVTDDFSNDLVVDPATMSVNPDYDNSQAWLNPYATIPGAWRFWGRYLEYADGERIDGNHYRHSNYHGFQIFQRHGRLYTVFGDVGQDVGGAIGFSSLRNLPLQLDSTKYVHSMWRVSSDASHRRYWTWAICGGATREELVDTTTHEPKIRPVITENTFVGGGDNPTAIIGGNVNPTPKECLSIVQEGRPEGARSDGKQRSSGRLTAQIHPAGAKTGIIALGNSLTDSQVAAGSSTLGFRYRVDASGVRQGPLIEPFDQTAPLTHFDVFLRPDRLVVFINGRQGFCVDLSGHKLTMKYGMVTYGDLLYHSALEWQEVSNVNGALYQHQLNTPIATSRVWDAIYESDHLDVPSQFATFDPSQCRAPSSLNVQ